MAKNGTLSQNRSFRGAVGELVALDQIRAKNLRTAGIFGLNFTLLQPDLPGVGFLDFSIILPGKCSRGCPDVGLPADAIGPGTGGRVGTVDLGTDGQPAVLHVEVTTSSSYVHMLDRALRVGAAQTVLDRLPIAQRYGVTHTAALAIDRGAYFRLPEDQRAALRAAVGKGSIVLVRDLQKDTIKMSDSLERSIK